MAKFRPEKGKRQRDRAVFTDLEGQTQELDLRLLDAEDPLEITTLAEEEARRRKAEPKPGNETYDYARDVYKLFRAAVDPESPLDNPEPFFLSVRDIYKSLDRDRVHYLVMRQEAFQNSVSPLKHEVTDAEFEPLLRRAAAPALEAGARHPFSDMALPLLLSFTTILARQLLTLRQFNSAFSGSDSPGTSTSTSGSPPSTD